MNAIERRRRASWAAFQKAKKMSPAQRREAALKAAAARPPAKAEKRPYIPQDSEEVDIPSDAFSAAEEDGEWEE